MHRSRLSTFVIDCRTGNVEQAARFWSAALGRKTKPMPDDPTYVELETRAEEPILLVQQVDHESRIHLDIEADDLEAEAKRLEALGARRVPTQQVPVVFSSEVARSLIGSVFEAASGDSKLTAWEQYAQVLLLANEFAFVD